jgi:hypothetical protein
LLIASNPGGFKGVQSMLDGKRYYAAFPDEDPANKRPIPRRSPALIAALRVLEKELRSFIRKNEG